MSIHFGKPNYQCPKCQSIFIPYKKGIKCPNCGNQIPDTDSKEYLDALELIANSMEMHKERCGRYFPGAWYTGDFMDHVQKIVYRIFDSMEEEKPEDEEKYLLDLLENKFNWVDGQYLKGHMKDITSEIFKIYKTKNFADIPRAKVEIEESDDQESAAEDSEEPISIWKRIKKWL
jgi:hypothetical protein